MKLMYRDSRVDREEDEIFILLIFTITSVLTLSPTYFHCFDFIVLNVYSVTVY